MGRPWVGHPSWELVEDAAAATGRDIAYLLLDASAAELTETRHAQLATFTLSMVALDAVERLGISPTICAGHSLGEYAALVAAGALSFDEGARVVAERGEAMQVAADEHPGTMAVVLGLAATEVADACLRADDDVWVANDNAPSQVVIAGSPPAVARAGELCQEAGARKVLSVPVGGAFHTPYMEPARPRLRKALRHVTFYPPEVTVIANVDARPHADPADQPGLLSAQLLRPVRWRQTLLAIADDAPRLIVELGAGGVLTGLARRTVPGIEALAVATPDDLDVLADHLAGAGPLHTWRAEHVGEHLYISERMVVSPCAGVFEPARPDELVPPAELQVGDLLGTVADQDVRTPFAGQLMGMLALAGERVQLGQPIAWLRAS
jgi:[acyl-carrier-protein] S-malonyltransferase